MRARPRIYPVVAVIIGLLIISFVLGCGDENTNNPQPFSGGALPNGVSIRQNSSNTFTIHDSASYPESYVNQTCDTLGMEVAQLHTPGEAYEWLEVVCAPSATATPDPLATPTPAPTPDPEEEFTP